MSILKELTKDFQYEVSSTNPEVRKLTSGPFRGIWVNRNGFCYSERNGKTLKISQGYYKRTDYKAVIKPWRLCALVWHDQTPSLHLDSYDRDKYLNLLAFIKVLEKYPDEYELFMNGLKTNYYPLSRETVINVVTGCLGSSCNNYKRCRLNEYERIKWDYFEEIGDKIEMDFYNFKDELSEELEKNLKGDLPKVTEDKEEDEEDPEEELEVCLSDPKLGGAPSLRPKVKEDHSQSDICHSGNNIPEETRKMEENYSDIEALKEALINKLIKKLVKASEKRDGAGAFHLTNELNKMGLSPDEINERVKVLMEAQDSSVLEENELRGYRDCTSSPNVAQKDTEEDKTDVSSSSGSIEELQELFDRRAKLKKELDEIEEKIKASIFH